MTTSPELTAKFNEMKQLRQINGKLQELVDAQQPAPPPQYDILTRIVEAAADSAERHEIAAKMIEAYWFDRSEWIGGEYTTMQIWDASLRFVEQALAAGYEWTGSGWMKGDKGWSQAAVARRVEEMVTQ